MLFQKWAVRHHLIAKPNRSACGDQYHFSISLEYTEMEELTMAVRNCTLLGKAEDREKQVAMVVMAYCLG